jgi:hypothetical protein
VSLRETDMIERAYEAFREEYARSFPQGGDEADHADATRCGIEAVLASCEGCAQTYKALCAAREQIGRLGDQLCACEAECAEHYGEAKRLREVCARLIAAYDAEESAHGFPFTFELRQAHRELCALITNTNAQEGTTT